MKDTRVNNFFRENSLYKGQSMCVILMYSWLVQKSFGSIRKYQLKYIRQIGRNMVVWPIVQHITVQISQQAEIVVFRVNFVHQDFKSTKNVLEGTWRSLLRTYQKGCLVYKWSKVRWTGGVDKETNIIIILFVCIRWYLLAKLFLFWNLKPGRGGCTQGYST